MVNALQELCEVLTDSPVCLVEVLDVKGSAPRSAGTWMAVLPAGHAPLHAPAGTAAGGGGGCMDSFIGTIGGGHLEFQALAQAQDWLRQVDGLADGDAALASWVQRYALGPALGQCCGGAVQLRFSRLTARDIPALQARWPQASLPVAVFGAGHVGRALVQLLQALPCSVQWIDSRDDFFPPGLPPQVQCEHSAPVQGAVPGLAPGARVVVMSYSHVEDLEVVAACLRRQRAQGDLGFIGLIGSATKWATFRRRLAERGFTPAELDQVVCPVGVAGVVGKEPAVIAVAVAAQLLQTRG